jgi:hypothetical protein
MIGLGHGSPFFDYGTAAAPAQAPAIATLFAKMRGDQRMDRKDLK